MRRIRGGGETKAWPWSWAVGLGVCACTAGDPSTDAGAGGGSDPGPGVDTASAGSTEGAEDDAAVDGAQDDDGADDDGNAPLLDVGSSPDAGTPEDCDLADVLVVLDRSQSMHRDPAGETPTPDDAGYATSRWSIALHTLEDFSLEFESGLRIGVELFPAAAPGCVTLAERIAGTSATNTGCGTSELVVAPEAMSAEAIGDALDPLETPLCNETPIAVALADAAAILAPDAAQGRRQFVVLVSDGGETCGGGVLQSAWALADELDVLTYVVAFTQTVATADHGRLNRLACAGRTAAGFPAPCVDTGGGHWDAVDPDGPALYVAAEDGAALAEAFEALATDVCCGSGCPAG